MVGSGIPLAFSLFPSNPNEQTALTPLEKSSWRVCIPVKRKPEELIRTEHGLRKIENEVLNNQRHGLNRIEHLSSRYCNEETLSSD